MRNFCFNGFAINSFVFIFIRWPLLSVGVFWVLFFIPHNASAQFQLHCDGVSAAGSFSSSANARLLEIAGQPPPLEPMANANFILHPGFIPCLFLGLPTGVDDAATGPKIPKAFALHQNYPNPFNPETSIQFSVVSEQFVSLKVYDVMGKAVATLVNEKQVPGYYRATFDGRGLASGVYLLHLRAEDFVATRKMLLTK